MLSSPFELHVSGCPALLAVRRFDARERMSAPYRVVVMADLPGGTAFERDALGARARLSVSVTGAPGRTFHGVVTEIEQMNRQLDGSRAYELVIEPRLAELRETRHRRIFHEQTSVDVVRGILREHGVTHRLRLLGTYPTHAHRLQYDESDLAFIERILFEEGIFYFFDHPPQNEVDDPDATNLGTSEVMVLCDTAEYYPELLTPTLVHRGSSTDGGATGDPTSCFDVTRRRRVRTAAAIVRGRTVAVPTSPLGDARDGRGAIGATPDATFGNRPKLVVEHEGSLEDRPPAVRPSTVLLEEARREAVESSVRSHCPHAMPGRAFHLMGSDDSDFAADQVIAAVDHRGEAPRQFTGGGDGPTYENMMTTAPRNTVLRASRRAKPRCDGFDTATVVGPKGQEIWTDEFGRVKVQFVWDMEGELDDRSSAWLRVAQSWAGAGFGAQFLPRVGMEVLVGFVAGDVDRPIVVGCVHNGASPTPFKFPEERTMSGFRTRGSPGGVGFNEVVVDDQAGAELVRVRSERFLAIESKADSHLTTGGNRVSQIGADSTEAVRGRLTRDISGPSTSRYGSSDVTEVTGSVQRSVGGRLDDRVHGDADTRVDGLLIETVGKSRHTVVGASLDKPTAVSITQVNGNIRQEAADRIELFAAREIMLRVGRTTMLLTDEGVSIRSPHVELPCERLTYGSSGGAGFMISDTIVLKANEIKLVSSGASLVLDSEAKLDGATVKLNCGPGSASAGSRGVSGEAGVATFRLVNFDAERHRGAVMRVQGPSGVAEHPVDGEGKVRLQGRAGDRFTLVAVLIDGKETATEEVETT